MTVYILIREDQNEHGYIDTSITGVFREEREALECMARERLRATEEGLVVEDDESDADWQVSWKIEQHSVSSVSEEVSLAARSGSG
jgi:hypothetical protein